MHFDITDGGTLDWLWGFVDDTLDEDNAFIS
jgi:hypothetical protein